MLYYDTKCHLISGNTTEWWVKWIESFYNQGIDINCLNWTDLLKWATFCNCTCLFSYNVPHTIKRDKNVIRAIFCLQAPILTMSGSSAEVRVPGTPPDPSCPLIWVRSAVPPYASPTVSCSACSSIRDSSRSEFQPHKQPASSPLLPHLLVWRKEDAGDCWITLATDEVWL